MHEFAAPDAVVALNQTDAVDRSVAPALSEYCSANVCLAPVPQVGTTESAVMIGAAANVLSVYRQTPPSFVQSRAYSV